MKFRKSGPDLEQHVVGGHGELAGVQHQALAEQREEAVAHHDLGFPPARDKMEIRSVSKTVEYLEVSFFYYYLKHSSGCVSLKGPSMK